LCQFHPIQFVAGLTRISAYSRPCQAGFAGVWFRHEKPLRFRAIPPEPLQLLWTAVTCHRFQSADMSAHSKGKPAPAWS